MKKEAVVVIICSLILFSTFGYFQLTGKITRDSESISGPGGSEGFEGPTEAEMACMVECTTRECDISDMTCRTAKSSACGNECGVDTNQPAPANEGEACMQECIVRDCDTEVDFNCQRANIQTCEDECGMKGDAPDESEMSEEQLCITKCVAAVDKTIICGSGTFEGEGETGNEVCQRCANECVHLYAGPCLTDELWREKENDCMVQGEHMEAAPIKGDSGEGYECTIDLECIDRSNEWGDEPGEGPGIGQEGYVAPNAIAGAIDGVIKFFKNLFGGGSESSNSEISAEPELIIEQPEISEE